MDCPKKFRVKRRSHQTLRESWQSDETSLMDVLEGERRAWLACSPDQDNSVRDILSADDAIESYYHVEPSLNRYLAHDQDSEIVKHTSITNPDRQQPEMETSSQPHHQENLLPRKSFFKEGSMNQASKATASTWSHNIEATVKGRSQYTTAVASVHEVSGTDSEMTPRRSIAGSACSSIDINEFKPLPATPTTFKATVKRFGQRLKPIAKATADASMVDSSKPIKKGIRKSMSSWKIFNSSASDADDDVSSNTSVQDCESVKTDKTTMSFKTVNLLKRKQAQPERVQASEYSILDERKRKAEKAYAEQFGGQKKRRTSRDDDLVQVNPQRHDPYSTVRQRAPATSAVPQYQPKPFSANTTASHGITSGQIHDRSSSTLRDSQPSMSINTDRYKRRSRSELEKENQTLRSLLRESQSRDTMRTSGSRSCRSSLSDTEAIHISERETQGPLLVPEAEDYSCGSEAAMTIKARPTHQHAAERSPSVPTMPHLPIDLSERKILKPVSPNPDRRSDTATVKRRDPMISQGIAIQLPRPLSMVLEGIEDDHSRESGELIGQRKPNTSTKKRFGLSHDGAISDEEGEVIAEDSSAGKPRPCKLAQNEQWQWPEDVF